MAPAAVDCGCWLADVCPRHSQQNSQAGCSKSIGTWHRHSVRMRIRTRWTSCGLKREVSDMHPISPRETLPLTRMIAATLFTIVSRFELCTAVLASFIHSSLSRGLDRKRRVRVCRNERWYQIGSRQVHGGLLRVYHHAQQLPQGARRGQLDGLVDAGGLSTGHSGTIYAMSVRHGGGGDGVRANSCTSGFMIEVHGDIFCARILLLLLFFCSLLFLVQPAKPLRGWGWGVCVAKSHACEVCESVWITAYCYTRRTCIPMSSPLVSTVRYCR